MKFVIDFNIQKYDFELNIKDNIVFIGSCFSENIYNYLNSEFLELKSNPFGIVFNPLSIFEQLDIIIDKNMEIVEKNIIFHDNQYKSLLHHSIFNNTSRKNIIESIENKLIEYYEFLQNTKLLIITFGSSYYYNYKSNNQIVANCHKIKSNEFEKKITDHLEIEKSFAISYNKIKNFNPKIKILFTISPVRHIKDGVIENNISKSNLILAIDNIKKKFEDVYYFPSYEIVIDQLRDYRFYGKDMVHPNEETIKYIYNIFVNILYDNESQIIIKKIENFKKIINHNIVNEDTDSYNIFNKKIIEYKNIIIELIKKNNNKY